MTSHRDSHTTTDVNLEIIPGVLTGNEIPHDKCNIHGIAHARTNTKDNIFMQRPLLINEAHMVLDIFHFTVLLVAEQPYKQRCLSVQRLFDASQSCNTFSMMLNKMKLYKK